jgi:hypothetical protein
VGWYNGASLTAVTKLCGAHGYGLAAGSDESCSAFFTRDGTLKPGDVWKPKTTRAECSGIPHEQQWDEIKHLPFVKVQYRNGEGAASGGPKPSAISIGEASAANANPSKSFCPCAGSTLQHPLIRSVTCFFEPRNFK